VIDEISMFPGRLLSYLDLHCRKIRENDAPFGGIQVVCVGDFLQLPPVDKDGTGYDWAFLSRTWQEADFTPAVLKTVHRQDEREFIDLLNGFRTGNLTPASVATMGRRVSLFASAKIPRLYTHNAAVDKWNHSQLESLPGETESFKAIITGDSESQREWLIKNLVTPFNLELRPGARVMITANLTIEGALVASNGTMGTLTGYLKDANKVSVETDDGRVLTIGRWRWDFDPQDKDSAKFYQFPLRLAWASKIHKAQGLTLDQAWIDIRAAREPGQAYVALSRVRSLAGLHLKAVPTGIFISPAAVAFHERLASTTIPVAAAPVEAECLY
jgi:ATP-dependent exoDNAse (exonuclease V) alpha subunit